MTSATSTTTRGRPRDEERTAAILEATHEVIQTKGWNDLRMEDIARAAGCGLATIYRRWDNKEELVADAMRAHVVPAIEETGDPATDLRNLVQKMAEDTLAMGDGLLEFMAATRTEPVLQAALDDAILTEGRPRIRRHLEALLGDSPHIELLIDSIAGAKLVRAGVLRTSQTADEFADEVMALVDTLRAKS